MSKAIEKKKSSWDQKERKFKLNPYARFDSSMLPMIQNLLGSGCTVKDIGMIVGYQGNQAENWLMNLKRRNEDVALACDTGYQMANTMLIAQCFREAVGYDYQEEDVEYKMIQDPQNPTELKEIPIKKTVHHKKKVGNPQLLMFMMENHMPEDYKRRQEIIRKNLNWDLKTEPTAAQIDKLFGKLCETNIVDAEMVEEEIDVTK